MGFLDAKWAETAKLLRSVVEPNLVAGETLIGVVAATQAKTFSAKLFAVGVTADRLVVVPVDRRWAPTGEPARSITRGDITNSSVWGWGGSVADFLSMTSDQQIRLEAHGQKYKWMVLGGNVIEDAFAGADHLRGLDALVEFVLSARR